MKNTLIARGSGVVVAVFLCLFIVVHAYGGSYPVLNGLTEAKVVFDLRAKSPKSGWIYLDLIHKTFKDKNIREVSEKPAFAVVIVGPAVKLVSTATDGFSEEDKQYLHKIAATVSAMAQDGIQLEICLYAASLLGVDPATILPEIAQYDNGWISLFGYQAKGYHLIPAY